MHLNQEQALKECRDLAALHGVNLNRPSSCYPPGCTMHVHSQAEKDAWAAYASDLASHGDKGHRPDRTEEART